MGLSFSLLIEIIQLITSLGYFDPDDIMLNTLGMAIALAYGNLFIESGLKPLVIDIMTLTHVVN